MVFILIFPLTKELHKKWHTDFNFPITQRWLHRNIYEPEENPDRMVILRHLPEFYNTLI